MKALTNEQLKAIEALSNTVVYTRSQLAEGICEALGEGWTWHNGFVNGNGNSIVLYYNNSLVEFMTYQYKDPKSVSIKLLAYGDYTYIFDYYGKIKTAYKRYEKVRIENNVRCISYEFENLI